MVIETSVPLARFTFWKIGGAADHFCQPTSVVEVQEAVRWASDRALPVTVLGGGTNILVSDRGIGGLVIGLGKLTGLAAAETDGRLRIEAMAGAAKAELAREFLKRKLSPALFLCGLPGQVGGGVVMNAGVGEAIEPREFVEITDWIDVVGIPDAHVHRWSRDQIQWTYRHTSGWQPGVVVRAGLSWPLRPDQEIPRKVKDATRSRLARQPLDLPSCGSTFKNPPGGKAGAFIDRAGLKGFQVGGAQISHKHANFIVNLGQATADDVRAVIAHVQEEVRRLFGVTLELEVKYLGRE